MCAPGTESEKSGQRSLRASNGRSIIQLEMFMFFTQLDAGAVQVEAYLQEDRSDYLQF